MHHDHDHMLRRACIYLRYEECSSLSRFGCSVLLCSVMKSDVARDSRRAPFRFVTVAARHRPAGCPGCRRCCRSCRRLGRSPLL